jgi:hypothetical protein
MTFGWTRYLAFLYGTCEHYVLRLSSKGRGLTVRRHVVELLVQQERRQTKCLFGTGELFFPSPENCSTYRHHSSALRYIMSTHDYSRSNRKSVYLACRGVFSKFENAQLRRQKAIRSVVDRYHLGLLDRQARSNTPVAPQGTDI